MRFKVCLISGFAFLALAACTGGSGSDVRKDENIIGAPPSTFTANRRVDGVERSKILMFDETVRKIHQFDILQAKHERSMVVQNPGEKHFPLSDDNGNYVVDISLKHVSVFNKFGQENKKPVHFQGTPIGVAYRPELGIVVIYDSLKTVVALKVDQNGNVIDARPFGSAVATDMTIAAGDLLPDGKLILSLNHNGDSSKLVIVDTHKILTVGKWSVEKTIQTTMTKMNWLAPVPGSSKLVLISSADQVILLDIDTNQIVSTLSTAGLYVEKYSKSTDPHIIFRGGSSSTSDELQLVYVQNSQVKKMTLPKIPKKIMVSNLDLQSDMWTFVETSGVTSSYYNDPDEIRDVRGLVRYRFSDMLGTSNLNIPAKTQVQLSLNYALVLYPNKIGYAVRYDIKNETTQALEYFNKDSL